MPLVKGAMPLLNGAMPLGSPIASVAIGHCVQRPTAKKELEEHRKFERWREDALQPVPGLRTASLQAYASIRHGRD